MNSYEKVLVVILALILLGEFNVMLQSKVVVQTKIQITNIRYPDETRVEITYNVKQGSYPNILKVALIPVSQPLNDKNLYVYYDTDYPSSFISYKSMMGIIDHLQENQRLKGYLGKLEIVDASRLKEVMTHEYDSILIIPSGVLPDTVHTKENSLVKQYLENGGTLVWIGDVFAIYSGKYREKLTWPSPENPGLEAQEKILGYIVSDVSNFESADTETKYSEALSLKYSGIHAGIYVEEVLKHNGLVLGKVKENRASIGMVPVGKGSLILFGGRVTARTLFGEDFVASDIANILLSGIIHSNGQIAYQTIQREDAYNQKLEITINDHNISGFVFLAVSDDYYSYFFFRQFIPKP